MRNELITYTASSLDRVKMQQDSESECKRAEPRKGQEKANQLAAAACDVDVDAAVGAPNGVTWNM